MEVNIGIHDVSKMAHFAFVHIFDLIDRYSQYLADILVKFSNTNCVAYN